MNNKIFHSLLSLSVILTLNVNCLADVGLTEWQGIANKNKILRITHDKENLYVSSSGGGMTIINKTTGKQSTYNRANGNSFDNAILDMTLYGEELWATGTFYGLGILQDSGCYKFDMKKAGCVSTQWMQGLLIDNPTNILVGGLLSFYQFNGQECTYTYHFNELSPMAMITDIKETSNGDIFVSASDWGAGANSLFKFTNDGLIPINNLCYRINRMASVGNTLWLASDGEGLVKYENGEYTQYDTSNSTIPSDVITDISIDANGDPWLAVGSYLVNFSDGLFQSFAMPEELTDGNDVLLSVDVDGNTVYAGSNHNGIFKLEGKDFIRINLVDNPAFCNMTKAAYRASSCMDSEGNFLMGSTEGLNVYNPGTNKSKIIPCDDLLEVIVSPHNEIWLRRSNPDSCLVKMGNDPLVFSSQTVPLPPDELFNIMTFDKLGNLWVAIQNGLMRYDGNSWKSFTEKDAGFPISHIKCLAFDSKNRLWCGAFGENREGNGLIMYDGSQWRVYKTDNSQIPSDFVGAINVDHNDVVWLNCRDKQYPEVDMYGYGLTAFDGNRWITYNTSNSKICSDNIYSIDIDSDNTKWLATTGDIGVMSFDGENWRLYNVDNSGIALNTVNDITIDPKADIIWFVHPLGMGVSKAKLNVQHGDIDGIIADFTEGFNGQSIVIYNLQGRILYYNASYQDEPINLPAGIYVVVTRNGAHKIHIK